MHATTVQRSSIATLLLFCLASVLATIASAGQFTEASLDGDYAIWHTHDDQPLRQYGLNAVLAHRRCRSGSCHQRSIASAICTLASIEYLRASPRSGSIRCSQPTASLHHPIGRRPPFCQAKGGLIIA